MGPASKRHRSSFRRYSHGSLTPSFSAPHDSLHCLCNYPQIDTRGALSALTMKRASKPASTGVSNKQSVNKPISRPRVRPSRHTASPKESKARLSLSLRSRTGSTDDDTADLDVPHFERHKGLWFEDGNIVLIAQDVGFRVYRGILARYSEVFRDMLEVGHPSDIDLLDGAPVVVLADSVSDVACFLDALTVSGTRYVTYFVVVTYLNSDTYLQQSLQERLACPRRDDNDHVPDGDQVHGSSYARRGIVAA